METTNIAREMAALPPEAQKQVVDFMTFFLKGSLLIHSTSQ